MLARLDLATEHNIEQIFKSNNLPNIASGEEDGIMKMYFYGRLQVANHSSYQAQQSNLYIELEVDKMSHNVQMSTKCDNEDYSTYVSKFIEDFLRNS